MRVGTDYRRWNHIGSRRFGLLLNVVLTALCLVSYALSRLLLRHRCHNWFLKNHFSDVLAGILLPAYSNALIAMTPLKTRGFVRPCTILTLVFIAALFWEFVAPLFVRGSTSDPKDIIAYMLGGGLYCLFNMARKEPVTG